MVTIFPPDPVLQPFIECYNVISHYFESPADATISARGVPLILFPFNSPPYTTLKHGELGSSYTKTNVYDPLILTAADTYNYCTYQGDVRFVMVILKPTGAYHFLRSSVSGLSNWGYTLSETGIYKYFDELQDRLWNLNRSEEAVLLIEQFLIKYIEKNAKIGVGDFSPVMNYMFSNPTKLSVKEIALKFKCSERWIERMCASQTGLSPKKWIRLIRFRSVVNYWLKTPQTSWMEIVVRFNYHDQSHLIKDFRDFTGNSPVMHFDTNNFSEIMLKQNKAGISRLIRND